MMFVDPGKKNHLPRTKFQDRRAFNSCNLVLGSWFFRLLYSVMLLFLLGLFSFSRANPEAPVFVVSRADGPAIAGPLLEVGEKWSVRLGGDKPVEMPGNEVLSLRREGAILPPAPQGEQVILTNGDRIPARLNKLAGDRLHILVATEKVPQPLLGNDTGLVPKRGLGTSTEEWIVPLSALAEIWIDAPDGTENPEGMRRRLAAGKRGRDRLLLRNGDVMEGILSSLDEKAKELQIDIANKPVTVSLSRVSAIVFNSELARSLRPKEAFGRVILDNGSRISLVSARADSQVLTGKTAFGAEININMARVLALDIFQGRAVYVSDLQPLFYEYRPYLGDLRWPFVRDGNVAGGDLRLRGSVFDKGLGMHSRSRLTYALEEKYRRFEATVGLDDRLGRQGTARIQVLVDGKSPAPDLEKELTGRNGPQAIQADVSGAKELTLVVDFGAYGEVQGCVDWADARLIK
jgi:hypothetical protein